MKKYEATETPSCVSSSVVLAENYHRSVSGASLMPREGVIHMQRLQGCKER